MATHISPAPRGSEGAAAMYDDGPDRTGRSGNMLTRRHSGLGHRILDHADDGGEDRAADATTDDLADDRADVEAAARCALQHRDQRREELPAADTARIKFLGRVDEEDKLGLYRAAEMFVFPSRYEGFGLDPLDALACGIPTLCSDASSLPELMGQAAKLVGPDRGQDWTGAIIELAASPARRQELATAGPGQAAKFGWQKTAGRTLELYHAANCIMTRSR